LDFAGFVFGSAPTVARFQALERQAGNMATNYEIGDFLIRIKNAARAGRRQVTMKETKLIKEVAKALKREGYLREVSSKGGQITVNLVYKNREPVLIDLRIVSKPGLRVYKDADELSERRAASIYILTTPEGILSSKEAIKKRVGGEAIVEIW